MTEGYEVDRVYTPLYFIGRFILFGAAGMLAAYLAARLFGFAPRWVNMCLVGFLVGVVETVHNVGSLLNED